MKQLGVDAIDFYVWRGASWAGQLGWPAGLGGARAPHGL